MAESNDLILGHKHIYIGELGPEWTMQVKRTPLYFLNGGTGILNVNFFRIRKKSEKL